MTTRRTFKLQVLLAAIALGALPSTALAGLNGQQISFRTSRAEFEWVRTRNWWFKGKVTIEYQFRGEPATYSCHYHVNEQQPDFHWVNLLVPQQLVYLNRSSDGVTGTDTRCDPRPPGGTDMAVPDGQ